MKILLLDIETSPNIVYTFDLFNAFISPDKIIKPTTTLCWSAKWLGEEEIMFDSIEKSSMKKMLKGIYNLINEADVVVHYNGKKFDTPVLNRDFILSGMTPPKPVDEVDLYQVVKRRFRFPSNKLSYVVAALGVGIKSDPTHELWVSCLDGDHDAWAQMEEYNKNDVILLEGLYEKLKGWIKHHPNHGLYVESVDPVCPNCGGNDLSPRGYRYTKTRKYRRFHCNDKSCGHWPSYRMSEGSKGKIQNPGVLA